MKELHILSNNPKHRLLLYYTYYIIINADFTTRIALKTGSVEIVKEISAVINKFDDSTSNLHLENENRKMSTFA